jgi:hypothetical protein
MTLAETIRLHIQRRAIARARRELSRMEGDMRRKTKQRLAARAIGLAGWWDTKGEST